MQSHFFRKTAALAKRHGPRTMVACAIVAGSLALGSEVAVAGGDTTFATPLTTFTGYLTGSGGKIVTVLSVMGGIVAMASGRFSIGQILVPVGVGIAAGSGASVATGVLTATI